VKNQSFLTAFADRTQLGAAQPLADARLVVLVLALLENIHLL